MPPRFTTRILAAAALLGAIAAATPSPAATDPAAFISDLGKRAIDALTANISDGEREARFRALFEEGFDVPAISRFVLGPYWRTATDAQKQEFAKLFEAYEVHVYAVRFKQYSGQQLKVMGSRPEGEGGALVQSTIVKPGGGDQPVKVDWRVSTAGQSAKISDVVVEGVSMSVTERQEFASVIQRNGGQLEALLKMLRERAGQG